MLLSRRWCALAGLVTLAQNVLALGQEGCVEFKSAASTFPVVSKGKGTPILLSSDDWPGVHRAALDFASDIQEVTGTKPSLSNVTATAPPKLSNAIIVGTLGKSSLIQQVIQHANISVSSIQGQWESFVAKEVQNPLPGIESAYVIIGADKRGSIYALYDHSEQFGVSPWYWWADVPTTKHSELYVTSAGCSHGSPSVKYRGIFFNDEQPALTNWAMEKFTNGTGAALTGSPFNHFFYTKVFELLLRMKGNYLWPAQWASAFAVDDHANQVLADWYGIVMGTSHEEPMTRSIPVEWNLFGVGAWDYTTNADNINQFWIEGVERAKPYENIYTVGMRGLGDLPLSEGTNVQLLESIVAEQRTIMGQVFNGTDVTTIPQMWCLYTDVQGYYEDGMRVPDDVTLLWADDNYGNVRRFPTVDERNRTGGAGVYYHVDFVGPPRDYKWITSSQIPKTFEQLSLASDRAADRIWILNVGDMKPYEMDTEFFITYGWDTSRWQRDNVNSFITAWAQREFDLSSKDAQTVTELIANVTRMNSRRKPESVNSTTYSLTNYREAETVLAELENMSKLSTSLYNSMSAEQKPAFFQLVHHRVQATYTLLNMWISAGSNNLRASQARVSANALADQVQTLFDQDYDLEEQYHTILSGKWDHMMDQTHVMYYYWQQPMQNTMPPVSRVQARKQALPGPMRISPEGTQAAWPGDNPFQCAAQYNCPFPTVTLDPFNTFGNRYIDVGLAGPATFKFTATTNASWLHISPSEGTVSSSNTEERVFLSVDWSKVEGVGYALINFTAVAEGQPDSLVPTYFIANHTAPPSDFKGFVQGDGVVSIEAAHVTRNTSVDGLTWVELAGYGRTESAITPWPRGGDEKNFTAGSGPSVEYDFYLFNTINDGGNITVTTYVSPSLNANGQDRPVAVAIQVDSLPPQTNYFIPPAAPGELPDAWDGQDGFAVNNIVSIFNTFSDVAPGAHTLKVWMVEPAVVVQKVVIDAGGLLPSYLGPPESIQV